MSVVIRAVSPAFVVTHQADRPEAHPGIGADGVLVGRRGIDGQAVVAADLDEVAGEGPESVAAEALALVLGVEEDVEPRMPVVGLVLFMELDRAHDMPGQLDDETHRPVVVEPLVEACLDVTRPPPSCDGRIVEDAPDPPTGRCRSAAAM